MKSLYLTLLFLSLVLFSSCSKEPDQIVSPSLTSYGKAYFVDPLNGNDNNNGRQPSSPVKTLFKAGAYCSNGDTVYVKGGTYTAFKDVIIKEQTGLNYLYFRPYPGETVVLDGTGGTYTETDAILTITNSTYIDISGFEIRNNEQGRGINILSNDKYSGFIKIANCSIHDAGSSAIYFGCTYFSLENSEIYNTCLNNKNRASGDNGNWPAAVQTYFKYNYNVMGSDYMWDNINISDNKIHNNWGEGIKLNRTKGTKITDNKIYNCYNAGIILDNSNSALVFNNFLYSTGDEYNRINSAGYSRPMQGVVLSIENNELLYNSQNQSIVIYNNLFVRTSAAFAWHCDVNNPRPSNSYKNIKVIFNTFYNTIGYESFALDVNSVPARYLPSENEFKNNIIYKATYNNGNQNYFTASNDYQQYWSISNNCFASGDIPVFISNVNISGNPFFVNPSALSPDGFKIANNSLCKGAGTVVASIAQDYFLNIRSNTPSIGFYEVQK